VVLVEVQVEVQVEQLAQMLLWLQELQDKVMLVVITLLQEVMVLEEVVVLVL
jgi:hypothetical protein